jgi:hypothetical protein
MWSLRQKVRFIIVLLAGMLAGAQAVGAYQYWRQYRQWRDSDPSAADAYLTFAQVDALLAVVSLAVAGLLWWMLRPRLGS